MHVHVHMHKRTPPPADVITALAADTLRFSDELAVARSELVELLTSLSAEIEGESTFAQQVISKGGHCNAMSTDIKLITDRALFTWKLFSYTSTHLSYAYTYICTYVHLHAHEQVHCVYVLTH